MEKSKKKLGINWSDGMKISEDHLIKHDNFILDNIRDSNALYCNNFNYGLIPVKLTDDTKESFFNIYLSAGYVNLLIKEMNAVTKEGCRIEINDCKISLKFTDDNHAESTNNSYYIIVTINIFDKIPHGELDLEEVPPRKPYVVPKFDVKLLKIDNDFEESNNNITIGKVSINKDSVTIDSNFIPPCTTVRSHPKLIYYYNHFSNLMFNLEQNAKTIIAKVNTTKQSSTLVNSVKSLCKLIITYTGRVSFNYRNIIPGLPPVYMIDSFASFANEINNHNSFLSEGELEEMLNYTFDWSDIAPHVIKNQLSSVIGINYNHNNCGDNLLEIKNLIDTLVFVFEKLSNLDFIGQRKENIIVNETDITITPKQKGVWNLLD